MENSWNTWFIGSPSVVLCPKLGECQRQLRHWNITVFGNLDTRLLKINDKLDTMHSPAHIAMHTVDFIWDMEREVLTEKRISIEDEGNHMVPKLKTQWIQTWRKKHYVFPYSHSQT